MSTDYADWTPDELRAEIAALVITVERLEHDRDGLRQEWHKVNNARRRNAIENAHLRSEVRRLRSGARRIVAAAKKLANISVIRPTEEQRVQVVNDFADAIDDFDPMLSETTNTLDPAELACREDHNSAIEALVDIANELDLGDGPHTDVDIVEGVRALRRRADGDLLS